MSAPEIAANTDSRLRISDATVGSVIFCATIWSVYPTQVESMPQNRIGIAAEAILAQLGSSNMNAAIVQTTDATANCIAEIATGSPVGT